MFQAASAGMFLLLAFVPSMHYAADDAVDVPADTVIVDPQIAMDHAADAIAGANGIALTIRLRTIPEERYPFAARDGDDILLPPAVAAQAHDRLERLALAAVVASHFAVRPAPLRTGNPVDPAKVAAALALGVAGSRLDRVDPNETDPALRNRQALTWRPDAVTDMSAARVAAARALAMLEKAGGCSAPLVAVMQRIADRRNAGPGEPTRQFARRVVNSLGSSIYPPDRSCLRG